MRYLVAAILLCVACGGRSDCNLHDGPLTLHASEAFATAGCEAISGAFDVAATLASQPDGSYVLTGTENGVAFSASGNGHSSDCYALPTWYESSTAAHMYFLSFAGGPSRLDVVRLGQCMVSYSLR